MSGWSRHGRRGSRPQREIMLGADDLQPVRPLQLYDQRAWWARSENDFGFSAMENSLTIAVARTEAIDTASNICHVDRSRIAAKAGRSLVTPALCGATVPASIRIQRHIQSENREGVPTAAAPNGRAVTVSERLAAVHVCE